MGRPKKRHPGGRPPAFATPEELDAKLEQAFSYMDKHELTYTLPEIIAYLGIHEDTWKRYKEQKNGFIAVIKRAEARIENRIVRDLVKSPVGLIFYLKNKHLWQDRKELITTDTAKELTDSEREEVQRIAQKAANEIIKERRDGNKSVLRAVK